MTAGEAGNISVPLRQRCVYGSMYVHIGIILLSPALVFDCQVLPGLYLILVEAISLPVQHLKNLFWISTHCFNPLQTSNGALLLGKLET